MPQTPTDATAPAGRFGPFGGQYVPEVLMGALRWQKENAERGAAEVAEVAEKLKRVRLDAEEAELLVRLKSLQVELEAKQVEKALLLRTTKSHEGELSRGRARMEQLRGADAVLPGQK